MRPLSPIPAVARYRTIRYLGQCDRAGQCVMIAEMTIESRGRSMKMSEIIVWMLPWQAHHPESSGRQVPWPGAVLR